MSNTGQPDNKTIPATVSDPSIETWLNDAPNGQTPLDVLLGTAPPADNSQQVAPQTEEQPAPPQEDYFLRGEHSVYKTPEEAVRGINEKDRLINKLREEYQRVTGRDPITGRFVAQPQPATTAPESPTEADYLQNPAKYLEELNDAVARGDGLRFFNTQVRFVQSILQPYLPVVQNAARTAAIQQVKERVKDERFDTFLREELPQVLQDNPTLASLIEAAESNPALASHLPSLYETAYYFARGRKLPELVKAQPATVGQPASPPPRPTMRPGSMPPPTPTTVGGRPFDPNNVDWGDPEQRKAYMRWLESKGVLDAKI